MAITVTIPVLDAIAPFEPNYYYNIANRNNLLVTSVFPVINTFSTQLNTTQAAINQSETNTKAYQDTSKIYRDESLANKNLSLTYKTASELAYNNTFNLVTNLVIPTSATYTYNEANARFVSETENFLNFKIGE